MVRFLVFLLMLNRCNEVAQTFGYSVDFHHVGQLLHRKESDVGGCTQMGIFKRLDSRTSPIMDTPQESYELAETIEYPFFEQSGFSDEEILEELEESAQNIYFRRYQKNPEGAPLFQEFTLDVDDLWSVLRNRQFCKRRSKMEEVLFGNLGQTSFIRLEGTRLQCRFQCPPLIEELNLEEKEFFPEWSTQRSDTVFEGWGETSIVESESSGW